MESVLTGAKAIGTRTCTSQPGRNGLRTVSPGDSSGGEPAFQVPVRAFGAPAPGCGPPNARPAEGQRAQTFKA